MRLAAALVVPAIRAVVVVVCIPVENLASIRAQVVLVLIAVVVDTRGVAFFRLAWIDRFVRVIAVAGKQSVVGIDRCAAALLVRGTVLVSIGILVPGLAARRTEVVGVLVAVVVIRGIAVLVGTRVYGPFLVVAILGIPRDVVSGAVA